MLCRHKEGAFLHRCFLSLQPAFSRIAEFHLSEQGGICGCCISRFWCHEKDGFQSNSLVVVCVCLRRDRRERCGERWSDSRFRRYRRSRLWAARDYTEFAGRLRGRGNGGRRGRSWSWWVFFTLETRAAFELFA